MQALAKTYSSVTGFNSKGLQHIKRNESIIVKY